MRNALLLPSGLHFARRLRHAAAVLVRPLGVDRRFTDLTASCWSELETPHREILQLKLFYDRSYEEIGRELGIAPESVKVRILRARECLRNRLAGASPAFAAGAPGSLS